MDTEWIKQLKIGDKFSSNSRFDSDRIYKVLRVTPKQIVTTSLNGIAKEGDRFNRETGRRIGDSSWQSTWMIPLTPEILKRKIKNNRLAQISRFEMSKLSNEDVDKIWEIVEPYINKK